MSETSGLGEQQDRKKEWLYFLNKVIEVLKSPTLEFFLGTFILPEIKFYFVYRNVGFSTWIRRH